MKIMSVQVKAKVVGDIPANRLLWLGTSEDGETMVVKLPDEGGYPVDLVSTKPLEDGEEVTVTITDNKIWRVEAGREVKPGDNVYCGEDGRLTIDKNYLHSIGYVLDAGEEGDIVRMVRNYKFMDSKMENS